MECGVCRNSASRVGDRVAGTDEQGAAKRPKQLCVCERVRIFPLDSFIRRGIGNRAGTTTGEESLQMPLPQGGCW